MVPIIVLGTSDDPHLPLIIDTLKSHCDIEATLLDYQRSSVGAYFDRKGALQLKVDGRSFSDEVVVFDRVKLEVGSAFYFTDRDPAESHIRLHRADEWKALYRLLCGTARRTLNPIAARSCLAKPFQQAKAAACGFLVPATLVSNSKGDLTEHLQAWDGKGVLKSLSESIIRLDPADDRQLRVFMTTPIDAYDLANATAEEIEICPLFCQEEISKEYEVRVIWVNGRSMAFKINSQDYATTSLDWRYSTDALKFEPLTLPLTETEMLDRFMDAMGLFCGVLDLVVDRNGDHWFLECNQQGAWAWLDFQTNGEISRLYAEEIAAVARST